MLPRDSCVMPCLYRLHILPGTCVPVAAGGGQPRPNRLSSGWRACCQEGLGSCSWHSTAVGIQPQATHQFPCDVLCGVRRHTHAPGAIHTSRKQPQSSRHTIVGGCAAASGALTMLLKEPALEAATRTTNNCTTRMRPHSKRQSLSGPSCRLQKRSVLRVQKRRPAAACCIHAGAQETPIPACVDACIHQLPTYLTVAARKAATTHAVNSCIIHQQEVPNVRGVPARHANWCIRRPSTHRTPH